MASSSKEGSIFSDLWRRVLTEPSTPRWAIAAAAYLLILAVTANHLAQPQMSGLKIGMVASKTYLAQYSTIYVDSAATEAARNQAAQEIGPVYSIDTNVNEGITTDLADFFLALDDNANKISSGIPAGNASEPVLREALVVAGVNSLRKLLDSSLHIQRGFLELVTDEMLRQLIVTDKQTRDTMQDVIDRAMRERIVGIIYETDVPKALESLRASVLEKADSAGLTSSQGRIAAVIGSYFIRPNAALDVAATELARKQERDATPAVQKEVRKGQVFLREGEIINQEDIDILSALGIKDTHGNENAWIAVLLFAVLLATAFVFSALYLPGKALPQLADMRYFLLMFAIVIIAYLSSFFLVERLSSGAQGSPASMILILSSLPITGGAVLLAHYFNRMAASTVSGFMAVMVTLASGDPAILVPSLMPALVAALLIRRDATRSHLIRAIIILPLVWTASILAQAYAAGMDLSLLRTYSWILLYGIAPTPIAMVLANFVLDGAFNIPTQNRLREFDSPDHPLLKKLQLEASGTWHHSMMVGLIAEAACQALGGNTLLVRVSCMYHDIGKTRRPEFFVENQFSGINVHDKYSPWLSKIIIESHVKDGVTMAHQSGLPQEMIDMIPQHHGTSLITYFFRKALAMSEDGYVNEYDYRYPGPKPQSLEAACINLADACESATRTLEEPTPHRIESLVHRIFEERLLDGQYDECGLALNQLDTIKTIITERLIGAYHARIEYPEEEELRRQFQLKRAEHGDVKDRKGSKEKDE